MKNLPRVVLLTSVFLLVCLSFIVSAGMRQDRSCPVIRIRCSSDKSCCGPKDTFAVDITGGYLDRKPTYKWSVSAGDIKKGQGTDSIIVDTSCADRKPITVTVEIGNVIPDGCPNSSSYTTDCDKS